MNNPPVTVDRAKPNDLRELNDPHVRFTPVRAAPAKVVSRAVDLKVPGYEILETISNGAMSTVLKARQISIDRVVAIKFLGDAHALDPELIARFRRESRIAATLSHPNIVTTIDAGEVEGRPYLVMEKVDGGRTVQDYLDLHGTFDEPAAIKLTLAVARALKNTHGRGLIHRDLKPANLILTPDGDVKLADLGLARPTDDTNWALAEAGMAVGTPEYISPEQIRGQIDVDIRSDIYGLGATLYHMVTGQVPFGGATSAEALRRHVDPKIPLVPPDALNPALTRGLVCVIQKMMARNREDRYRDPDDLLVDLENLIQGHRPLIAEPLPDTLACLSSGEPAPVESTAQSGMSQVVTIARPSSEPSIGVLILIPACVLALCLLVAAILVFAR